MVSFTSPSLYHHGNGHWYSQYWRLGGPQNWSGFYVEDENLLSLPVLEVASSVTEPIECLYAN
jgi:hypothetical protein